jgi:hypothetical protein
MQWTSCPHIGSVVSSHRPARSVAHGGPVFQPGRLWECPSRWLLHRVARHARSRFKTSCIRLLGIPFTAPLLTLLLFPTAILVTLQSLHQSGPPLHVSLWILTADGVTLNTTVTLHGSCTPGQIENAFQGRWEAVLLQRRPESSPVAAQHTHSR